MRTDSAQILFGKILYALNRGITETPIQGLIISIIVSFFYNIWRGSYVNW